MEPLATGPSRAVVTPQEQRVIDSNLQKVLRIPGNDCCADCGAKHPRWASVNLGVVICLECSGIHRKMGVHISKVKSVTLDRWTAQWVKTLEAIGNEVAKNYYEHSLPADIKRPTRSDDPNTIENWIRTKYERKNYAPKGVPEPWTLVAEGKDPRAFFAAAIDEKKEFKSRKSHNSDAKKSAAASAPSLLANEPWMLSEPEDFAAFGSQAAAAAAAAAPAAAGVFGAEPQLSATDQRLQAAKATIARVYAAPHQLGFGAPSQPEVRPEGLEGLCFFNTQQQHQQQPAAAASPAAAPDWTVWGPMDSTATAAAVWPGAPGAPISSCPFSGVSVGFAAPSPTFAAAAAAPQLQRPAAAAVGDPWAACGARLNGQNLSSSPVTLTIASDNKQSKETHSALSSLDAFALARKVQLPTARASPSPPSDSQQHQQQPANTSSPSVPVQQREPLLLI